MKIFVRDYFIILIGLYIIFYSPISPISEHINLWQKDFLLYSMRIFIDSFEFIDYQIIINPHYHLEITSRCTSSIPLFLLWAFILAHKNQISKKIKIIALSLIVINIFNILRISFVAFVVKYDSSLFFIAHSVGGNIILGVSIFGLLGLYLRK